MNKQTQRIYEGARAYAQADRSDPFAFSRAMSHAKNGISSILPGGEDGFYNAEFSDVKRTLPKGARFSDGSDTFIVKEAREVKRP